MSMERGRWSKKKPKTCQRNFCTTPNWKTQQQHDNDDKNCWLMRLPAASYILKINNCIFCTIMKLNIVLH